MSLGGRPSFANPPRANAGVRATNDVRHSASRFFAVLLVVAPFALPLLAGCSRLSGDHEADQDAEQAARMERLLDDAPESLKSKRAESVRTSPEPSSASSSSRTIAEDFHRATSRPTSGALPPAETSIAAPTTPSRPVKDPRRSLQKKSQPAASRSDEIPDAAEIGL